jgi:hypothetical protein
MMTMTPDVRRLFDKAAMMSQSERRALMEGREKKHPTEYTRHYTFCATTEPIRMPDNRRQEVMDSLTQLLQSLYGIPHKTVSMEWGQKPSHQYSYRNGSALFGVHGKSIFDYDGQYNSPISIDYCVRLLWWDTVWELEDCRIAMKKGHNGADVVLKERKTHYLDDGKKLHREDGPAILDPNDPRRKQYWWHGDQVDEALFINPSGARLQQVTREPGFSLIGGWEGLTKHNEAILVQQRGDVKLMEVGGSKTYYFESAIRRGEGADYKGRRYHTKPDRFLYDPKAGMSGWVSKEVKTIAGAQRSLLRKKLTQYNKGRK